MSRGSDSTSGYCLRCGKTACPCAGCCGDPLTYIVPLVASENLVSVKCPHCGRTATVRDVPPDATLEESAINFKPAARTAASIEEVTSARGTVSSNPHVPRFRQLMGTHSKQIQEIERIRRSSGPEEKAREHIQEALRVLNELNRVGHDMGRWQAERKDPMALGGKPFTPESIKKFYHGGGALLAKYAKELLRGEPTAPQPKLIPERSPPPLSNRGTQRVADSSEASSSRRTMAPDGTSYWSSKPRTNSEQNVQKHARDHAGEFNLSSADYRVAALDFVCNPPPTAEIFIRGGREMMIYDPPTNTFAIRTPEGAPATMFKPKHELRYWLGQLTTFGGKRTLSERATSPPLEMPGTSTTVPTFDEPKTAEQRDVLRRTDAILSRIGNPSTIHPELSAPKSGTPETLEEGAQRKILERHIEEDLSKIRVR